MITTRFLANNEDKLPWSVYFP